MVDSLTIRSFPLFMSLFFVFLWSDLTKRDGWQKPIPSRQQCALFWMARKIGTANQKHGRTKRKIVDHYYHHTTFPLPCRTYPDRLKFFLHFFLRALSDAYSSVKKYLYFSFHIRRKLDISSKKSYPKAKYSCNFYSADRNFFG